MPHETIGESRPRAHGKEIDPDREVLVHTGGTEAILSAITAFIEPEDEVIVLEPAFNLHNPLGKVFSVEELLAIGNICLQHAIVILSDKVYERLYFTPSYTRIATLNRTIARNTFTVSSVEKAFNVTGWTVGYVIGDESPIKHVQLAHIILGYTTAGPAQEAAAVGLEEADRQGFWEANKQHMESRMRSICSILHKLGLPVKLFHVVTHEMGYALPPSRA
ncbi:hypothetical protein EPUS_03146 [Endocarpon pusillum Z07020]|uniref:Aminotransferase class I/classII large domain-containing protein n=1 Tax=Endocarpon pusillum (strain Z07020 / HMAS-L-300199) TaxID=1263415 RepID=U1GM40_ENDPU|nr:uncharacterized protein EPUS_03146 [Endocarpon pusillum Z07020]ERF73313.1 hypothetical protein EPUS_03146 [Endocarpon pusillum Z07020]